MNGPELERYEQMQYREEKERLRRERERDERQLELERLRAERVMKEAMAIKLSPEALARLDETLSELAEERDRKALREQLRAQQGDSS